MSRYTDANCKLCRREGQKLFLKGERCYSTKCALEKRNYAPGQHGQNRKKQSEYGNQLREKQKAKRFYGVQETQFRNLFDKAAKKPGKTGENLLILLDDQTGQRSIQTWFCCFQKRSKTAGNTRPFHDQRQEGEHSVHGSESRRRHRCKG